MFMDVLRMLFRGAFQYRQIIENSKIKTKLTSDLRAFAAGLSFSPGAML